jgi:hypothetical protein
MQHRALNMCVAWVGHSLALHDEQRPWYHRTAVRAFSQFSHFLLSIIFPIAILGLSQTMFWM